MTLPEHMPTQEFSSVERLNFQTARLQGFEMTKCKGVGRGGARPGSGRKPNAITPRVEALKQALAALKRGASNFGDADRRFVRAMIALGASNHATAGAFGISEADLLAKFPDELESRASDLSAQRRLSEYDRSAALRISAGPQMRSHMPKVHRG
jgi:hypothetical protein